MNARPTSGMIRCRRGYSRIRIVAAGLVLLVIGAASTSAQTAEDREKLSKLGPDGFAGLPLLAKLVEFSDAAIIGRVVGTEGLALREVENERSDKKSILGYANYRLAIDDVLFTRNPVNTDSLIPGSEIVVGMEVGRDSAEKFVSRTIPVGPGDTCLFFFFARPHGWALSRWHTQFRRTAGSSPAAENLGRASFAAMAASEGWRGASVTVAETSRGAAPEWTSLVAEVRRLGAQPVGTRRR